MCHTLIQHYLQCSHTNATFISCNNFEWYPSYRNDGLTIEWRDHSQLKSIAHSYERECGACLKKKLKDCKAEQEKIGLQAWQAFSRTAALSANRGNGDYQEAGRDRNDAVVGNDGQQSTVTDLSAGSGPVPFESPNDRSATIPRQHRSPTQPQPQRQLPALSIRHVPLTNIEDFDEFIDGGIDFLTTAALAFPGLETCTIHDINEVITLHTSRFSHSSPYAAFLLRGGNVAHDNVVGRVVSDPGARLLLVLMYDYENTGYAVLQHMIGELRWLLGSPYLGVNQGGTIVTTTTEHPANEIRANMQVRNVRLILEWLVVFLNQFRLACDQLGWANRSEPERNDSDRQTLSELAIAKYKGIVRGSRTVIWNAVLDAVNLTPQDVIDLSIAGTMQPSPLNNRRTSTDRNRHVDTSLERRPDDAQNLSTLERETARDQRIPETIVASAPPSLSEWNGHHKQSLDPGATQGRLELSTCVMVGCNEPTHTEHEKQKLLLETFLVSRYHHYPYRPSQREVAVEGSRRLLIHFEACGHYNTIAFESLELVNAQLTASCGCRGFPKGLVATQRSSSLGDCVICERAKKTPKHQTMAEAAKSWEDTHFQRHARMVNSPKEIDLWPFSVDFDPEISLARLRL